MLRDVFFTFNRHKNLVVMKLKNPSLYYERKNMSVSPEIVLSGNRKAVFDFVGEICEYSPERISLTVGKLIVTLTGVCLSICDLGTGRLTVCGDILSLSFSQ